MAISSTELEKILLQSFPHAKITITDLVGDQDHYSLEIEDVAFIGHSLINQHKIVKNSLATVLGNNKLHAITIKTKIPTIVN